MSLPADVAKALPNVEKASPTRSNSYDDEKASMKDNDEKAIPVSKTWFPGDVFEEVREIDLGADGKERPIGDGFTERDMASVRLTSIPETAEDWSIRLISLEDDPTLPVWTFRLWFCSLGLSCFGAVLSQIFVRLPCAYFGLGG